MGRKKNIAWISGCIGGTLLAALLAPDSRKNLLILAGLGVITVAIVYFFYCLIKMEKKKYVYRAMLITSTVGIVIIGALLATAVLLLIFAGEGLRTVKLGPLILFQTAKNNVGAGVGLVSGSGSFALYILLLVTGGAITYLTQKKRKT